MRFLEAIQDVVNDIQAETPEQQFDADFVIMTETLQGLMNFLVKLFAVEENTLAGSSSADQASMDVAGSDKVETV